MKTLLLKAAFILIVLILPGFSGTITGKITNGTSGYSVPDELTIHLTRYTSEGEDSQFKMETPVQSNGEFIFRNVPDSIQVVYVPVVTYGGVKYKGTAVSLSAEVKQGSSTLTIYEPTHSDSLLQVAYHHMLIKPGEGVVSIQEILVIENMGDRALIGSGSAQNGGLRTLFFPLPANAAELSLDKGLMSCCIETAPDGFYDTMEFLPGRKEFVFSYRIEAPEKVLNLTRTTSLPTTLIDVIPVIPGIQVKGNGFNPAPLEGTQLTRYSRSDIPKSEKITISIVGLPGKPVQTRYWFLAGVALLLLAAGGYMILKSRRTLAPQKAHPEMETDAKRNQTPEALIREIALLDEAYEANEIEEKEYRIRREELKGRLQHIEKHVPESQL